MKLLHLFAGPFPTVQGTQVLIDQTCTLLAEAGHDVVGVTMKLWCYGDTPAGELERRTLETVADPPSRRTDSARLSRLLSGDLDDIVAMALRKEPDDRYGSVDQFIEDLERYRNGEPVHASAGALRYRLSKFVWRHRWAMAAAVALVVAVYLHWQRRKSDAPAPIARTAMVAIAALGVCLVTGLIITAMALFSLPLISSMALARSASATFSR